MSTEWDPAKNEANKAKHGLSFEDFVGFDAEPVVLTRVHAFGRIAASATASFTSRPAPASASLASAGPMKKGDEAI